MPISIVEMGMEEKMTPEDQDGGWRDFEEDPWRLESIAIGHEFGVLRAVIPI